jgi:hypothetical protein
MVDATAKTNSVTMSTGIKLAVFLSNSFRNAPSSDWIRFSSSQGNSEMVRTSSVGHL